MKVKRLNFHLNAIYKVGFGFYSSCFMFLIPVRCEDTNVHRIFDTTVNITLNHLS